MILNTDIENFPHNLFWMLVYRSVECVETILQVKDTRDLRRSTIGTKEYFFEEFTLQRAYFKSVPAIFSYLNDLFDMSIMCKDLVYKTDMRTYEDKVIISLRSKVSVNLRDRDTFFLERSQWQRKHIRKRYGELDILHDIPTMLKRVILSVENKPMTPHEQKDEGNRVLHYTCTPSEMLNHPGMALSLIHISEPT